MADHPRPRRPIGRGVHLACSASAAAVLLSVAALAWPAERVTVAPTAAPAASTSAAPTPLYVPPLFRDALTGREGRP